MRAMLTRRQLTGSGGTRAMPPRPERAGEAAAEEGSQGQRPRPCLVWPAAAGLPSAGGPADLRPTFEFQPPRSPVRVQLLRTDLSIEKSATTMATHVSSLIISQDET
jgi:hypothetical protein